MDLPEFHRGRRLRRTAALRDMVREVRLCADDLIMPYFVVDTPDRGFRKPIDSMPGQFQCGARWITGVCSQWDWF